MELFDKRVLALGGARPALGLLFSTAVLDALLIIGQALSLAWTLSQLWYSAGTASADISSLALFVVIFAACYMARQGVSYARKSAMGKIARTCTRSLVQQAMDALYENGPRHVQRFGTGSVTAALVEGVERVESYIELSLPKSADLMAVPTVLAVALFVLDWVSGLIAVVVLPCIMMFMRLLGQNSKQAAAVQHAEYTRLTNHFADILHGFPTIKMFGRSGEYDERVYARSESLRSATVKTLQTVTLSSLVLDLFRTFTLAAIAIMLGFRLMDGSIGLFAALAVLIIVPEFFAPIRRYSADFHATLEGKNQLGTIMGIIDAQGPADSGKVLQAVEADLRPWTENSRLSVNGLDFTYPGTRREGALEDVDFEVAGMCKVGIVGASGAGKSTLISLLAGFERPDGDGAFAVDGVALDSLGIPAWQRQVSVIAQHPHLFHASLRDNVAFYCPQASDEQVWEAVRAVGLEELVAQLPDGLETVVGQGARQLSGGQAQRVALARAFLDEGRRIWLLDEPTAHLDVETELELKGNLLPLMEGRLVFFATHRLHWMRDMDVLVVLDRGRVAQVGTYEELSRSAGAFARLVDELKGGYGQ